MVCVARRRAWSALGLGPPGLGVSGPGSRPGGASRRGGNSRSERTVRERARLRATFGLTEHAYSLQLVAVAGREGGDQLAWANDEDPIPKPARDAGSLASPVEMMRHIVDRCPKTLAALGRLGADLRRACRPAVDPSAAYPVPQRRVIDTQLVGDLAYRFARRADDLHRVSFELIRELPSRSFPSQQDLLPSAQSLCRRQHALTVGNVRSLGETPGSLWAVWCRPRRCQECRWLPAGSRSRK